MKLLIADDEAEILKVLKVVFEQNKYTVETVDNGLDALSMILTGSYDGVILDIMMPKLDGLSVLRQVRAAGSSIPILLLSARGELSDRVDGLEAGADDYLPKPFAMTELLARVKSILRRGTSYTMEIITVGNLSLNSSAYELSTEKGVERLNNKEFQMMEYFMRNPKKVFSTEDLMEKIWGWESESEINVVWTNIAYLRRKLDRLEANVEIRSIRGVGYRLEDVTC